MAVVGINYDETNPKSYESVRISYGFNSKTNKEKIFDTGDFVKDWYDCNKFIIKELADKEPHFSNSSSVDHFIMDGAPFTSAYLKVRDDIPSLSYTYDHNDPGIEFFVKKGETPTWEELKKYCTEWNKRKK